jgi:hypothetical protein
MSATRGRWSGPTRTPGDSVLAGDQQGLFVIHAVLLHNGNVLWFSGHVEFADYLAESWVWDPTRPISTAFRVRFPTGTDIFCCHHVVLEDGRVLTAGGASAHPDHGTGIKAISVFNTANPAWEKIGEMREARWYPTLVTLEDGRILAFSGRLEQDPAAAPGTPRGIAATVELFNPPFRGPGYRTQDVALTAPHAMALHTYPGLHLVRGGKIFYSGTTWRYEPLLASPTGPVGTFSFRVTGPAAGTWLNEGVSPAMNLREEGTSVLLPPAQDGKILLIGGTRAVGHADTFTGPAAGSNPRSAEILDTRASPPSWSPAGPSGQTSFPRINASAVLLPDGTVFIVGGHNSHKWAPTTPPSLPRQASEPADFPDPHHPAHTTPRFTGTSAFSLAAEIFDPVSNTFSTMASMGDPRTYHSACLLLPDGRVVCAGGVHPTAPPEITPAGGTIPLNLKTMELFQPTYFFRGPRPKITRVLSLEGPQLRYGGTCVVETPDAARIDQVILMRPGAMTHHTDSEQRLVTLGFTRGAGKLDVQVVSDPTLAPPGFYMLWIVDDQRRPCERASFVRLSPRRVRVRTARCEFPRSEVEALLGGGATASFQDALTAEVSGFFPDELGIATATPSAAELAALAPAITFTHPDGSPVPGLAATPRQLFVEDANLPAGQRQRFTFSYALDFSGLEAFGKAVPSGEIPIQPVRVRAEKEGFLGESELTLFGDVYQRVVVTLRRTTGDRFVSVKEIELTGPCESREETDSTVFVSSLPGGSLRAHLSILSDQIDVEA